MHDQRDLQATQQIIDLFERSKAQSEEALEGLPGIYAIVDVNGRILKGNLRLAKLFGVDHEKLLGLEISALLGSREWQEFREKMSSLDSMSSVGVEFQSEIKGEGAESYAYFWYLSRVSHANPEFPILYSIIGRDITELNRATERNTRMQVELDTAKMVQETLFPPPVASFGSSAIAGYYQSASECGGDWWHYSFIQNKLFLWVGDVTGHGVPAALVASAVHSAVSIIEDRAMTTPRALQILNRAVGATASGKRQMTFLVASVDLETGEFTYSSASHEPIIVLPAGGEAITVRDIKVLATKASLPLGSESVVEFVEYKANLARGDRLFFYTDGLYDIGNKAGETWGRAGFRRRLASLASENRGTEDLVRGLCDSIQRFNSGEALYDDATFFVFEY